MERTEFEVTAPSLNAARALIEQKLREAFSAYKYEKSEVVLSDGEPRSIVCTAATTDEAYAEAQRQVDSSEELTARSVLRQPTSSKAQVSAFDESGAHRAALAAAESGSRVVAVSVESVGSKGWIGIGRKPNRYTVEVLTEARVEVLCQGPARIKVTAFRVEPAIAPNARGANPLVHLAILTNRPIPAGKEGSWVSQIVQMKCKYGMYTALMDNSPVVKFSVFDTPDYNNANAIIPVLLFNGHIDGPEDIRKLTFGDFSDGSSGIRGGIVARFKYPLP